MSKEEYLKRYLSTQDETKAKSKKKRKKKMSNTLQLVAIVCYLVWLFFSVLY